MKKYLSLIAISLMISAVSYAGNAFSGNDTGKVDVVKLTFKLYKPATKIFQDGFLKVPGVIDYHIDSLGNCVLYAKPEKNLINTISQTINKSGYKFTDMMQEDLSEAAYESIKKDAEKVKLSQDKSTGTQKK